MHRGPRREFEDPGAAAAACEFGEGIGVRVRARVWDGWGWWGPDDDGVGGVVVGVGEGAGGGGGGRELEAVLFLSEGGGGGGGGIAAAAVGEGLAEGFDLVLSVVALLGIGDWDRCGCRRQKWPGWGGGGRSIGGVRSIGGGGGGGGGSCWLLHFFEIWDLLFIFLEFFRWWGRRKVGSGDLEREREGRGRKGESGVRVDGRGVRGGLHWSAVDMICFTLTPSPILIFMTKTLRFTYKFW